MQATVKRRERDFGKTSNPVSYAGVLWLPTLRSVGSPLSGAREWCGGRWARRCPPPRVTPLTTWIRAWCA